MPVLVYKFVVGVLREWSTALICVYMIAENASCMITITLDRLDYGPLVDGLPVFHYRMACQSTDSFKNGNRRVVEDRTRSVESAVAFVRDTIRETRILP